MSTTGEEQQNMHTPVDGAPSVYGAGPTRARQAAGNLAPVAQDLAARFGPQTEQEAIAAGQPTQEELQRCENTYLTQVMGKQSRICEQKTGSYHDWLDTIAAIIAAFSLPDAYAVRFLAYLLITSSDLNVRGWFKALSDSRGWLARSIHEQVAWVNFRFNYNQPESPTNWAGLYNHVLKLEPTLQDPDTSAKKFLSLRQTDISLEGLSLHVQEMLTLYKRVRENAPRLGLAVLAKSIVTPEAINHMALHLQEQRRAGKPPSMDSVCESLGWFAQFNADRDLLTTTGGQYADTGDMLKFKAMAKVKMADLIDKPIRPKVCWHCGEAGHLKRDCPKTRK